MYNLVSFLELLQSGFLHYGIWDFSYSVATCVPRKRLQLLLEKTVWKYNWFFMYLRHGFLVLNKFCFVGLAFDSSMLDSNWSLKRLTPTGTQLFGHTEDDGTWTCCCNVLSCCFTSEMYRSVANGRGNILRTWTKNGSTPVKCQWLFLLIIEVLFASVFL